MALHKIVVHTDVLEDHLFGEESPSVLRLALSKFFCYTTVFQAVELFAKATSPLERSAMEDAMASLKILGMNPKNSWHYSRLLRRKRKMSELHVLAAGLCVESGLPMLTGQGRLFRGVSNLKIVPVRLLAPEHSAEIILKAARINL